MSVWRRWRTATVVAVLATGVVIGAAGPGAAATTGGDHRINHEECQPYDHYKCPRDPVR